MIVKSIQQIYSIICDEFEFRTKSTINRENYIEALKQYIDETELRDILSTDDIDRASIDKLQLAFIQAAIYNQLYNEVHILSKDNTLYNMIIKIRTLTYKAYYKFKVAYSHKLEMTLKIIDTTCNKQYHLNYIQAANFVKELMNNLDIISYKNPELDREIEFTYNEFNVSTARFSIPTNTSIRLSLSEMTDALSIISKSVYDAFHTLNMDIKPTIKDKDKNPEYNLSINTQKSDKLPGPKRAIDSFDTMPIYDQDGNKIGFSANMPMSMLPPDFLRSIMKAEEESNRYDDDTSSDNSVRDYLGEWLENLKDKQNDDEEDNDDGYMDFSS